MERPNVVFPHPDSPTSPRVSPLFILKFISVTAFTEPTSRPNKPPLIGKVFDRFFISNKYSLIVPFLNIAEAD